MRQAFNEVLFLLLLFVAAVAASERYDQEAVEVNADDPPQFYRKEGRWLEKSNTFLSFFELEWGALLAETDGVEVAVEALTMTYNDLVKHYTNPFKVKMENIELLESSAASSSGRQLQGRFRSSIFGTARSSGSCTGCSSGIKFTDERTGRRLGGGRSTSSNGYPYPYPPPTNRVPKNGDGKPDLIPGLPTERELLEAYSRVIRKMKLDNFLDATGLKEIEGYDPPSGSKKSKKRSSGKGNRANVSKNGKRDKASKGKDTRRSDSRSRAQDSA